MRSDDAQSKLTRPGRRTAALLVSTFFHSTSCVMDVKAVGHRHTRSQSSAFEVHMLAARIVSAWASKRVLPCGYRMRPALSGSKVAQEGWDFRG